MLSFEITNNKDDRNDLVLKIKNSEKRFKIAVIGAGISGLSSAWLLSKNHDVRVYEKNSWIGGHSNTQIVPTEFGDIPVDTGFIVYNEVTYPNLVAMFEHFNVPTKKSEMSFAVSLNQGQFEYSGTNINGLFGQRSNIFKLKFWKMLGSVLRFYREAPVFLVSGSLENMSLGQFLDKNNFSQEFIKYHLLPMGAAIWSTSLAEVKDYPVSSFIEFFKNHGLMQIRNRPQWKTVDGGSREYVNRLTKSFSDNILLTGVNSIKRKSQQVLIEDSNGIVEYFDYVVIATHADEALQLLLDADRLESNVLKQWRYSANKAVLHTDCRLMPKRAHIWSSWNFLGSDLEESQENLCVTYWMNRLQGINTKAPIFLTLNPKDIDHNRIIREFEYTHPQFNKNALLSQQQLWSLQGHRRTWYCGSYFGAGFHEDGLQAGLAVAEELGGMKRPWKLINENDRINFNT